MPLYNFLRYSLNFLKTFIQKKSSLRNVFVICLILTGLFNNYGHIIHITLKMTSYFYIISTQLIAYFYNFISFYFTETVFTFDHLPYTVFLFTTA